MRKLHSIFNMMLLVLLGGQLLILGCIGYFGKIPVSPHGLRHLRLGAGISLTAESLWVHPWRRLEVTGLRFYVDGYRAPLLRIDELLISCEDPMACFRGVFRGEARFGGGVVYYPERLIPEASATPLVRNIFFDVAWDQGGVTLSGIRGSISRLEVVGVDAVSVDWSDLRSERERNEAGTLGRVLSGLREVYVINRLFEQAEASSLLVGFVEGRDGIKPYWTFDLHSEGFRYGDGMVAGPLYAGGRIACEPEEGFVDEIRAHLRSFRFREYFRLREIEMSFRYVRDGVFSIIPSWVDVHASEVLVGGERIEHSAGRVSFDDPRYLGFEAMASLQRESVRLKGTYDSLKEEGWVDFEAWVDPSALDGCGWVVESGVMDRVCFGEPLYLRGSLVIDPGNQPGDLSFRAEGRQLELAGVSIPYFVGEGRREGSSIRLDSFFVRSFGDTISGSLFRDEETTDYRYQIEGVMDPRVFSPWFDPWWAETWSRFEFKGALPRVDLDIWGRASDRSRRNVLGEVVLSDTVFRGLEIDDGRLNVRYRTNLIELSDIGLSNRWGNASGKVTTVYSPPDFDVVSRTLDLQSNMPIRMARGLVGHGLDAYLDLLESESTVLYTVRGKVVMPEFPEFGHLADLRVDLSIPGDFVFLGVSGENAWAQIHRGGGELRVDPVVFDFSGGLASGSCVISMTGSPQERISWKADLSGLDTRLARSNLRWVEGVGGIESAESLSPATMREHTNSLNLTANGEGRLGDWSSFSAEGSFRLQDPLITRVHMFGVFSRILDALQLGFASFSLNEARGDFRFGDESLSFDSLRLTGPSGRVDAKGTWQVARDELDFRLKSYPFQELGIPVFSQIALLLMPITHVFEVRVWGSIENPEWRLILDPSGL